MTHIEKLTDNARAPVLNGAATVGKLQNDSKEHKIVSEYKSDVLEKIIHDLNKKLNIYGRELRHSVHKKTGQIMVKVVDTETGKIIREIPPEKSLDILAKILERSGLLVDEKS
ncbi:MAG: flagellar protein FlaG [Clostridiales bacterium]|jgi:uncharacterized FlaG/YvyC family protein|nr:flagellar protein FlaG [Clostridiales bacterium]